MQLLLMYPTRASLWVPCRDSNCPKPQSTRYLTIPAFSKIEIQGGGIGFTSVIADIQGGFSLHIDAPHPGNINFHDPNWIHANPYEEYKLFDPIAATNEGDSMMKHGMMKSKPVMLGFRS